MVVMTTELISSAVQPMDHITCGDISVRRCWCRCLHMSRGAPWGQRDVQQQLSTSGAGMCQHCMKAPAEICRSADLLWSCEMRLAACATNNAANRLLAETLE